MADEYAEGPALLNEQVEHDRAHNGVPIGLNNSYRAYRAIVRLRERVQALEIVVAECGAVFRHYEELHRFKGDVGAKKAAVNAAHAARCELALPATDRPTYTGPNAERVVNWAPPPDGKIPENVTPPSNREPAETLGNLDSVGDSPSAGFEKELSSESEKHG